MLEFLKNHFQINFNSKQQLLCILILKSDMQCKPFKTRSKKCLDTLEKSGTAVFCTKLRLPFAVELETKLLLNEKHTLGVVRVCCFTEELCCDSRAHGSLRFSL